MKLQTLQCCPSRPCLHDVSATVYCKNLHTEEMLMQINLRGDFFFPQTKHIINCFLKKICLGTHLSWTNAGHDRGFYNQTLFYNGHVSNGN